jgi:hypothetical protein
MNQELMDMAKQAGWEYAHGDSGYEPLWKFAKLVAAAEREEIDKLFDTDLGCCYDAMGQEALNQMRAAIKARGDTK